MSLITNTPPSAILSDALTSLNEVVNIAFTSIQDQAHQEITQACAEAREARRERDEAVKALHELGIEEQAWKQEGGARQSAIEQVKLTTRSNTETITQLRYESEQWKQHCHRLEDTLRQEATIWKEFLRVEQERCNLAIRVNELIEEQLSHTIQTHAFMTPFTTMLPYPNTTGGTNLSDPPASTRHHLPAYMSALPDESISTSLQQFPPPISANCRAPGDKSIIVEAGVEVSAKEKNTENTISDEALPESSSSASSSSVGSVSTVPGSSRSTLAISSKTTPKPSKPTSAPSKAGQGTNKVVSATNNSAILNNKPISSAFTKSVLSKLTLSGTGNKPLSNPATSKPVFSSCSARTTQHCAEIVKNEDEDGENCISEQFKSGNNATAKDEVDSSEDDEPALGAEVHSLS
ncbi:hypothetical protein BD769DRAFT_1388809 [Suillus cothurnatus]|nr:hypothetical protein BD769DRAFT_1388809 [Suillus cothurnatus]